MDTHGVLGIRAAVLPQPFGKEVFLLRWWVSHCLNHLRTPARCLEQCLEDTVVGFELLLLAPPGLCDSREAHHKPCLEARIPVRPRLGEAISHCGA
jgi:hypothetical protein